MVVQYIATRPILDLGLYTGRRPVSRAPKRWLKKEELVLPGRQAAGEEGKARGGRGYESGEGYGGRVVM